MKALFSKLGFALCALVITLGVLPTNVFAAELEPATFAQESQQIIALDQLEQRITEDGTTLYDVTSLASTTTYLGAFTFTNTNVGAKRAIDGNSVRFIVEFKKADTQPTDIDLEIKLMPIAYNEDGSEIWMNLGSERILSRNCDEMTSDGFHRYTSTWWDISQDNHRDFRIYYDAMTEFGKTGTGAYRKASVRIWMEVSDNIYF